MKKLLALPVVDFGAAPSLHHGRRHRNRQTIVLGATSVPVSAEAELLAPAWAAAAPSPQCVIKGNVDNLSIIRLVFDHQNALAHATSTCCSTTTGSVNANVEP
jgi:hypothetical protein